VADEEEEEEEEVEEEQKKEQVIVSETKKKTGKAALEVWMVIVYLLHTWMVSGRR
jgi:hypothetical protein